MRIALSILAFGLAVATSGQASGGKYNQKLSIGDQAPDWNNLEGVDGKRHSLQEWSDKDVVVLVFTCNTCPYAVDYESRLNALAKKFAGEGGKAVLVAINPNLVAEDLLPAMQERAKAKDFQFAYLHDASGQQTAQSYGATFTPECVVLNKERKVIYLGAIDDSTDGKKVTKRYAEKAVAAALAGKTPEITETPAIGCAVRYVRERRKK